MKKYVFLIIALFCTITFSYAQNARDTLVVVPAKEGMYFYHVVTKEETLYSLSRKYHVEPKELAGFNHLTLKSQLQLFQLVKIPLNKGNFDQTFTPNTVDFMPLYHKVLKGETLYHISQLHGKVPDALLQKWNGLAGNEVKTGQYLIVGWLKTKGGAENAAIAANNVATNSSQSLPKGQSDLADNSQIITQSKRGKAKDNSNSIVNSDNDTNNTGVANNSNPNNSANNNPGNSHNANNNAFLNEVIASENASRHIHTSAAPVDDNNNAFAVSLPKTKTTNTKKMLEPAPEPMEVTKPVPEKKEPVKREPIRREKITSQPEKKEKPDSFDIMLNRVTQENKKNDVPRLVPSAAPQTSQQDSDNQTAQPATQVDNAAITEPSSSVASEFEQQYEQQTNNGTNIGTRKGAAGWFKSNVKPGSGRYYALCNDLPRGTIVEVINPLNEKSILVKILDVIPKGAENYNLIIKISDAAMSDLGVTQSRFWCEIQYPNQ